MPASVQHSPSQLPELLNANQAAEMLGISCRLLWYLAEQNKLPPVRINRCTRWRRADILRYIERLAASHDAEEASRE
jgi:predicted DNA-binding transcriptional regulator AlpA